MKQIQKKILQIILYILGLSFLIACGGDGNSNKFTLQDGATGIEPTVEISVYFNETIKASSITSSNFMLTDEQNTKIDTNIQYDSSKNKATLIPKIPLALLGKYTVTLKQDMTNEASNSSWSFSVRDGKWQTSQQLEPLKQTAYPEYDYNTNYGLYPHRDEYIALNKSRKISSDSSGNIMVVWEKLNDFNKTDIFASRFTPVGGWGDVQKISNDDINASGKQSTDVENLQVVSDTSGNLITMWQKFYGYGKMDIFISHFTPLEGWGDAQKLLTENTMTKKIKKPQVSLGDAGKLIAVWQRINDLNKTDIFASHGTLDGLSDVYKVTDKDIMDRFENVKVSFDPIGNPVVVWEKSSDFSHTTDLLTSHFSPENGWREINKLTSKGTRDMDEPKISFDALGNAIVVWEKFNSDDNTTNIFARYFTPARGWGDTQKLTSKSPIDRGSRLSIEALQVGFDILGNAIVAWCQGNYYDGYNIFASRFTSENGWGNVQKLTSKDINFVPQDIKIAFDASGKATVIWYKNYLDGLLISINYFK